MGKVSTTVTVTNRADQILVKGGYLATDKVRSVTLNEELAEKKWMRFDNFQKVVKS